MHRRYPAHRQAAQAQRTHTVWVTRSVQRFAIGESKAEGPLQARQERQRSRFHVGATAVVFWVINLAGFVGKQCGHNCGVARQLSLIAHQPLIHRLVEQSEVVGQVAVMPQGDIRTVGSHLEHRLCILPCRSSSGGVARVPYGYVPLQSVERLLIKNLGNKPEILEYENLVAVADCDTGGFLAAMLQGKQAIVGEFGHVFARCPNAKDATFFARGCLPQIVVRRNRQKFGLWCT